MIDQEILSNWLFSLSTSDPFILSHSQTQIKCTLEQLINQPISAQNSDFFKSMLELACHSLEETCYKLKLIECISLLLDYFFINSFNNLTFHFEEFLKFGPNIDNRSVCSKDTASDSESVENEVQIKIQSEVLETGKVFQMGDATMKVIEAKVGEGVILNWELHNKQFQFRVLDNENKEFKIGRSSDCHLRFKDDFKMSKHHALIRKEKSSWVLRDQGSKNGTWRLLDHEKKFQLQVV
ncbi:unnamed protein product [Blepharisma stoltei]|uniref:FHA domain-containing protein n=1 Tax=Blepharisma stoltei TaxID=1481888 RepID=A0AAU9KHG4_9CILI|nr:unnamed protein product [Blepharisma stoltei]